MIPHRGKPAILKASDRDGPAVRHPSMYQCLNTRFKTPASSKCHSPGPRSSAHRSLLIRRAWPPSRRTGQPSFAETCAWPRCITGLDVSYNQIDARHPNGGPQHSWQGPIEQGLSITGVGIE